MLWVQKPACPNELRRRGEVTNAYLSAMCVQCIPQAGPFLKYLDQVVVLTARRNIKMEYATVKHPEIRQ